LNLFPLDIFQTKFLTLENQVLSRMLFKRNKILNIKTHQLDFPTTWWLGYEIAYDILFIYFFKYIKKKLGVWANSLSQPFFFSI